MRVDEGIVTAVSRNATYAFSKPVHDEIVLVAGIGVAGDAHAGVYVKHRGRVRADPTQPNLRQVHLVQEELFAEVGAKGYAVAPGNLGENVTTSGIDLLALPLGTILRFGPPAPAGAGVGEVGPGDSGSGGGVEGGLGGGGGPLAGVLAAAAAATLDGPTAASAVGVAAAARRDGGGDSRPAVILAGLRNPCAQINGFREGLLREVLGRDDEGNLIRRAGVMAVVLRGGAIRPGYPVVVELPPPPYAALDRV